MPYSDIDYKDTNVNYLNKDFPTLKRNLIEYAKTYFPNTYKDFNETSPGMMLIEMSAYVGDVLNFYIDQQYREMLLPLSEDRRNLVTLAKASGYKPKTTTPAYADITVKQTIGALANGDPDYAGSYGGNLPVVTIDKGMTIVASTDTSLFFETLDVVDFKISSSADIEPEVSIVDSVTGLPTTYVLTRKVKAVGAETKTITFNIGTPSKFKKLTLPETNVVEVLTVVDANQNPWYEVNTLAQDKIPIEKHYSSDEDRLSGFMDTGNSSIITTPVPFSLEYIKTGKRFMVEVDENNKTNLVFGNGVLKNGNTFDASFLAVEQQGINLPGGEEALESSIDPLLGDSYGTLGEAPSHTTLTVKYRIGGSIGSNVPIGTLTSINTIDTLPSTGDTSNITITNNSPAGGGSSSETIEELRHRAIGNYSSQNRCVTKSDFESRTLSMPAKFGGIAKVYCTRSGAIMNAQRTKTKNLVDTLKQIIDKNYDMFDPANTVGEKMALLQDIKRLLDADQSGGLNPEDFQTLYETLEMTYANVSQDDRLYTVDLYLLSYNNRKQLIDTPNVIKRNLKEYLNEHRLITDQISFYDGYIINFGVIFDIIAYPYDNKDDVKFRCIKAIKDYFTIDKMQFKQVLYTRDVESLLSEVDGVRVVNHVTFTQDIDYNAESGKGGTDVNVFSPPLYTTLIQSDNTTTTTNNAGYGYYYDFSKFYGQDAIARHGNILPAYEPAVFELKNPNQNIKGIIR